MRSFFKRVRKRRQLDRDLDDELQFHLEMSGSAASLTALKETCRDMWAFNTLESWWKDLRYGARSLAKSPGVIAAAVIALALGKIGRASCRERVLRLV